MPRLRRLAPEETVVLAASVLALAYTLSLLWLAHRNGSLRGDDIVFFSDARRSRFLDFIAEPMDVHAVPLHRAVTYLVTALGRPSFDRLLVFMAAVHVLGVVCLYRALETFAPNPGNAVATFWYATFVELICLFLWWTSALHRFPYVALSAMALYAYARFRREQTPRWALAVLLAVVAALGFFEKGVVIPLMLAAIEASLVFETDARDRARNWLLVGGIGAIALSYFAAWRCAVGHDWSALSLEPSRLLVYGASSLRMLLSATVGRVYEWVWAAAVFWVLLIGVTIRRAPRTALLWISGLLVVTASLLSTGISVARFQVWGNMLPYYSHRYYPDVMFVVVVFVALVWQRAFPSGASALRGRRSRRLSATSAIMAMTALSMVSLISAHRLMKTSYPETLESKKYIDNVVAGIDALERTHRPLAFVDGTVPTHLNPLGGDSARHSILLHALGYRARFYDVRLARRGRGVYRIADSGRIELFSHK